MNKAHRIAAALGVGLAVASAATAQVNMEYVTVGDPVNAADRRYETCGYGRVDYVYRIGTYEVTAGQYCDFLNAVAATDTYDLYNAQMGSSTFGCKIQQAGSDGSYTYSVAPDRADRPVNFVSYYDCLRFANWLQNGQPTGGQVDGVTEDGTYDFVGPWTPILPDHSAMITPHVVVPTENEWYKAAYYEGGGTAESYWDYPTQSYTAPRAEAPPGTDMSCGSANYWVGSYVDPVYYTTEVGAYTAKPSTSAYGTFDQGGNLFERTETLLPGGYDDIIRGGHLGYQASYMHPQTRGWGDLGFEIDGWGFRVGLVPEPAAVTLLALGGLLLLRRRRR